MYDAVVIGGGFYGTNIALYLRTKRHLAKVLLLEREDALLTRASYVNQARVHGGYHYPRSFTTAYRSRQNMSRFVAEFSEAIFDEFTCIYAIARRNSKVTSRQMERFCKEIGADLSPAPKDICQLFNPTLIDQAYLAVEQSFNADILRRLMHERLREAGVQILCGHEVTEVVPSPQGVSVSATSGGSAVTLDASFVFNCTYSRLQQLAGRADAPDFRLRHEITEMVLVDPPTELASLGITVMDGAFFSIMPFPARRLHSLSHVRYTPHRSWLDSPDIDPYAHLAEYPRDSGAEWMIRDAARYVPFLARCRPVSTMFEVKTLLLRNEGDDGRPILFQRHGEGQRLFSILGGKIDNIYDILERLDGESLDI